MKEKRGVLITFSIKTEKLNSSERTKFFHSLYGWKQVVQGEDKKYEYERPGLIKQMPHEKVDQSSFIVPEHEFDEVTQFFEQWSNKVIWKSFKVLLDEDMEKMFRHTHILEEDEDD